MIGYLKGTILHTDDRFIILDVSGVGYKVFTNTAFVNTAKEVSFWTYLAVRETALDLYGFQTKEEMDFFELLITVSGIGPKSALSIMGLATLKNLRQAIKTGDVGHLVKVSGVGKKNAEKIVVELKDKIGDIEFGVGEGVSDMDALEALKSLGYNEKDAREVLKKVSDVSDTGEKVRKALKLLS
ncbi:MAG: Holliday junction branch migration protein RuvA [Patescibacteria group bacterium]